VAALAVLAVACATAPPKPPADGGTLSGLDLEAGEREVRARDARELLAEANARYDAGRFREAARRFDRILELGPEPELRGAALFNAGLAWEGAGDLDAAVLRFRALLAEGPPARLALDARFRLGRCEAGRGEWAAAAEVWTDVLASGPTPPDRAEALFQRGLAFQSQGDLAEAERDYRAVDDLLREHPDHPRLLGLAAISRARFQRGEIHRERSRAIRFRLPLEQMERAWAEKATHFLKAQRAFLDAVRLPNEYWAVAAGQRLGLLFEELAADILAADVPLDLDAETRAVYDAELRAAVRPYVERAIELYETNLAISARLGHDGEWVSATRERLVQLRALLARQAAAGPAATP
jgi:tetratricopeptide (TPR) repeat protein